MSRTQLQQRGFQRKERLEARITSRQKRLFERAAALRGSTVTELVITSAQDAATEIIRESEVLRLSEQAQRTFLRAMLHPPAPNAAVRAAAARYKKRMGL